jgi:hypothetical protein
MPEFPPIDPSVVRLHPRDRGAKRTDHFVEFYDDERSLVESVSTFVSTGIAKGDSVIVIATPAHGEAFETEFDKVIDLSAARELEQYVALDAEETLSLFTVEGVPDPAKFESVLAEIIGRVEGKGNLLLFGEMVAVLWAQGNITGALALEDLWNELARKHSFRLFCAYPVGAFSDLNQAPLTAVCDRHSHVLGPRAEAL